ncbi:T9SS type A sorting domain-containing protein [Pedobacter sp. ASV28]|uniref:T9SS type A sorting domain-containing protein n=1 Tax=Pedobacter sp. ASV28 TaxID=2795123 RepID=UPI0018EA862E|nr:T9SS type A sorting domain-containing protein [Pedobacter sp. ASV28]
MKKIYLLLLFVITTSVGLRGQIRYVVEGGAGLKDGSSWVNASDDLQAVINNAAVGDQVWVAKGTYKPTQNLTGSDNMDKSFILKTGVKIYGGFAGGELTTYDLNTRNFITNETILSGDFGGGVNAHHVVVNTNTISDVVLDGLTITGGNANGTGSVTPGTFAIGRNFGAGIFINTSGSVDFKNLIIRNNSSTSTGGGVYFSIPTGAASITNFIAVKFIENTGTRGGALYLVAGTSTTPAIVNITDGVFFNNVGTTGGALSILRCQTNITSTTFENNTGSSGGAVNIEAGITRVNSSKFSNNTSSTSGGAINLYSGTVYLSNSILHHNQATTGSGIIAGNTGSGGNLYATNNTFYGNKATNSSSAFAIAITNSSLINVKLYNNIFRGNIFDANNTQQLSDISRVTSTNQDIQHNLLETEILASGNRTVANNYIYDSSRRLFASIIETDVNFLTLVEGQATEKGNNALAIDAGILTGLDLAGSIRLQHGNIDLGAYEYQGVLPVHFDYFKVTKNGNGAVLNWRTLSETNSSHFIIERGSSYANLKMLIRKEANGTTSLPINYSYTDQSPLVGTNYYRLVQYDINGTREVLGEQVLTFSLEKSKNSMYPNPAKGKVLIKLIDLQRLVTIDLISLTGQSLLSKEYGISASGEITIDLSGVPAGSYILWINKGKINSDKKKLLVVQ